MRRKIIGILVCMLLVGTVLPVSGTLIIDTTASSNMSGNTLYVGGSGDGNYTRIQDAIDNASDEDTVFVYDDSSPYHENLTVGKSINLIGENKYTTIIDSNPSEFGIYITKDSVRVTGFTIQNSIAGKNTGITIYGSDSDNVEISDNIIKNTNRGIYIDGGDRNLIDGNIITDVIGGIDIRHYANNNIISNNTIERADYVGIEITHFSKYNTVTRNVINGSGCGIDLYDSDENDIFLNAITEIVGYLILFIINSFNNKINQNNFMNNKLYWVFSVDSNNRWKGNYWGKSRILPRLILVRKYIWEIWWIPDFDIDWFPAKEPYDI